MAIIACSFCGIDSKDDTIIIKGQTGNICIKCISVGRRIIKLHQDQKWREKRNGTIFKDRSNLPD
jgi:hypothetical protein